MKFNAPVQLTDADRARIRLLTRWIPRVKVTIPAREDKPAAPKAKRHKVYPY